MATSSFLEDQRTWLNEYTAEDLSRTLVRQYLYQHNMFKTLNCFENQDKQNSKKIIKSTLIKMLSINNLVVNNKKLQKERQSKSLLLLLVQYLRSKFQQRLVKDNSDDTKSQSIKNKQLSLNGQKIISSALSHQNKIKQKNLVCTKRNQLDEKTLTQDAFYKKKDLINQKQSINQKNSNNQKYATNQKQIQKTKLSSNIDRVNQNKKLGARPNTAKPSVKQGKQQQKVSSIYSKINIDSKPQNSKNKEERKQKIQSKQLRPSNAKINNFQMEFEQKNTRVQNDSNNQNRNIRNPSRTSNKSKQNNYSIKEQDQSMMSVGNTQTTKKIIVGQTVNKQLVNKLPKQVIKTQFNQKDKQQAVQEYYEEFQEQKHIEPIKQKTYAQPKHQPKHQSPPKPETKQQKSQIKPQKSQQNVMPTQNISIKKEITFINSQKQHLKKQQPQFVQKQKQKQKIIQQEPYNPTSASKPRGGKKLLRRTGPQFTKQEDATQMIGKSVKLLPDIIQPSQQNIEKNLLLLNKNQNIQSLKDRKQFSLSEPSQRISPIQSQNTKINQNAQPQTGTGNMIKLKKKVKNNEDITEGQPKINSKFKFDDNFVDQPLHAKKQVYKYEKFAFQKMTIKPQLKPKNSNIILENKINYILKNNGASTQVGLKKKVEKPLSLQRGEQLKKIVFQKGSPYLAKAWHQGFILSPFEQTSYGLKQIQGGPCGIIAAVQCYFLKHLLYLSKPSSQNDLKDQIRKQNCLVAALTDILWKAKGQNDKITLIVPTNRNFSGSKLDFSSLMQVEIQSQNFQSVYETIATYKSSFIGQSNHGVTVLIYSIVMTKGIQKIYNQVDMRQNPLIGHHGHCTQELVNLFISGQASSNCFDGKKQLDQGFILHGINQKSQFGFLTVFQTLEYIEVGKNLKNPVFPIWIISKQFHYHVIFGNHYLISQNNDCEKFDLIYFDGLYTCEKFIRITFDKIEKDEYGMQKQTGNIKNLPLIEQVLLKKWGKRKADWNGAIKIL